jgi:hypothetical protein
MRKLLLALSVILVIVLLLSVTVFEDGSWGIGQFPYILSGCLPFYACQ